MDLTSWKNGARVLDYKGNSISFHDEGEGPNLLAIHGFPTSSWDWHRLWPEMTTRFRTVTCDMMGFGFSSKPPDYRYSIVDQASVQETLCESLRLSHVLILCHDYGCAVTQELLARFIDRRERGVEGMRIEGICMLNGGLFPEVHRATLAQKIGMSAAGPLFVKLMNEKAFARNLGEVFAPETRPTREEMKDFWTGATHGNGLQVYPKILAYVRERERQRDRWVGAMQKSPVPLRFINGTADPVAGRPMAERYQELIPNPDVVLLEGVGHYPQLEAPTQTWEHAFEFLTSISDDEVSSQ